MLIDIKLKQLIGFQYSQTVIWFEIRKMLFNPGETKVNQQ